LGIGNTTTYSSPKQIGSLTNWSNKIATFNGGGAVIKTDGTLWTWGLNTYGELGLNNQTSYSSPKQVGSATSWYAISNTGQEYLLGVKG
jgi:alpha-tubulin suppressor-like RCC1 family protein